MPAQSVPAAATARPRQGVPVARSGAGQLGSMPCMGRGKATVREAMSAKPVDVSCCPDRAHLQDVSGFTLFPLEANVIIAFARAALRVTRASAVFGGGRP
jgi:hypothetical protein